MHIEGEVLRVTIYVGESARYHGHSLATAILEYLRRAGAAGATITRGVAGFGAHSHIHTATIEVLSSDLPMRIEWIDAPTRVHQLLPELRGMVRDGLIVQEPVTIIHHPACAPSE